MPRVASRTGFGWHIVTVFVVIAALLIIKTILLNPNMQWGVVRSYFTLPAIVQGLGRTLILTIAAEALGVLIGIVLAVMRISPIKILSTTSWLYIWFFRGTPLLVQVIFWYNLAVLLPTIQLGIPFTDVRFATWSTNQLLTPMITAIIALALNEGAYMSEIVRAGILSVDHGQGEAASALGMRRALAMRRVVLPQALRVIIPPTGNQTISMLKNTALVSVTSLPELLYSVQLIYSRTFETIPLLIVASLWYLMITTILTIGQYYLERRYARGSVRNLPPTPIEKFKKAIGIGQQKVRGRSGSAEEPTQSDPEGSRDV